MDHRRLRMASVKSAGRGYMHLCDDPDRDDGDLNKASSFEKDCNDMRLETVSMKDDFSLIYV